MTTINKNYRAVFYQFGDVNTVDFTVPLTGAPDVPTSPIIRPSTLNSDGVNATFNVVDEEGIITSKLADADGRMQYLGRRLQLQETTNGGDTWTDILGARVSNLTMGNQINTYNVSVTDEIFKLRERQLFEHTGGSTTQLFPAGPRFPWRSWRVVTTPKAEVTVVSQIGGGSPHTTIVDLTSTIPATSGALSLLVDVLGTRRVVTRNPGEATPLQERIFLNINGVDYNNIRIVGTETLTVEDSDTSINPSTILRYNEKRSTYTIRVAVRHGELTLPSGGFGFIHEGGPQAEPSESNPLHVGTYDFFSYAQAHDTNEHPWKIQNPIALIKKIFDDFDIRYNSDNMDEFIDLYRGTQVGFRVTSPVDADTWINEKILTPLGLILRQNTDAEVEFRDFRLPDVSDLSDVTTLPTFTHSNTQPPYPSWDHGETEMVTDIEFTTATYRSAVTGFGFSGFPGAAPGIDKKDRKEVEGLRASDLMEEEIKPVVQTIEDFDYFEFDDESDFGRNSPRQKVTVDLTGFATPLENALVGSVFHLSEVDPLIDRITFETFNKFGYGPIRSRIVGMSDSASLRPADIVRYNLDEFPNPSNNDRGGTRLLQIITSKYRPAGFVFDTIDLGPSLNPIGSPTIAVDNNSSNPKHVIDYTVTGILSGATVIIERSFGNQTDWSTERVIEPADGQTSFDGSSFNLPSGTQVFFRARQLKDGRLPSDWSTVVSETTEAISPPTNADATADGRSIVLTWEVGDVNYELMPVIDLSGFKDFATKPLSPNSTRFKFEELGSATEYAVGVKHVDSFGGSSTIASDTATTGTATKLRAPRRVVLRQARSSANDSIPEDRFIGDYGFEVNWSSIEINAKTRIQVGTDVEFNDILQDFTVPPGVISNFVITPYDDTTRYIRLAHQRNGFDQSDWSPVLRGLPTALIFDATGFDGFPSGYAFLSLSEDNEVILNIGSDDPDTDRAYYTLNTEEFVDPVGEDDEPIDDSEFIEREDFPISDATGIELFQGDTAYLWVRFWNEETLFSPSSGVKHKISITTDTSPTSIQIQDLKELTRTDDEIVYGWNRGERVHEVWVYDNLVEIPQTTDPWPSSDDLPDATLPIGTDTYTVQIPDEGFARFIQFEPRTLNLKAGPLWRLVVTSEGVAAIISLEKVTEVEDREADPPVGSLTVRVLDQDGVATNLLFRSKEGADNWSDLTLVTANPEHNETYTRTVPLVENHLSFLEFWLQFSVENKDGVVVLSSGGFDAGEIPDIVVNGRVRQDGQVRAHISGDFDTRSIKVKAWNTESVPDPSEIADLVRAETALNGREVTTGDLLGTPLEKEESAIIYAFGYSEQNGGGQESSEIAFDEVEFTRKLTEARLVTAGAEEDRSVDPPVGKFTAQVVDPDDVATRVRFRRKEIASSGDVSGIGGWVTVENDPELITDGDTYTRDVDLEPHHDYQVIFDIQSNIDGESVSFELPSPIFNLGKIPDLVISLVIESDGSANLQWSGDFDTQAIKWLAWLAGDEPVGDLKEAVRTTGTSQSGRAGIVDTGITVPSRGQKVFAAAIGYAEFDAGVAQGYEGELEQAQAVYGTKPSDSDIVTISGQWVQGLGESTGFEFYNQQLTINYAEEVKSLRVRYNPSTGVGGFTPDPGDGVYDVADARFPSPGDGVHVENVRRESDTSVVEEWHEDYPSTVIFKVEAYDDVGGAAGSGSLIGQASVVMSLSGMSPLMVMTKGETTLSGDAIELGVNTKLEQAASGGPLLSMEPDDPWTVEFGGTGRATLDAHALLIGNGTSDITMKQHPANNEDNVLVASGGLGTESYDWVPPGDFRTTVTDGEGILVTGSTSAGYEVAFNRYHTSIEIAQAGLGSLGLSAEGRIAVVLGDEANTAAPGNHDHDGVYVPVGRQISTTLPLDGGGDLTGDLTLSISGLADLAEKDLVIGGALGALDYKQHPRAGGDRILKATGGAGDADYEWVEFDSGVTSITAGDGLSGGGSGAVSLSVATYGGIDANRGHTVIQGGQLAVVLGTAANEAAPGNHDHDGVYASVSTEIIAGDGMGDGGNLGSNVTLSVGAGNGLTHITGGLSLGDPGTIGAETTNNVSAVSHTHALAADIADVTVSGNTPSGSPTRAGSLHFVV